MGILVDVVRRQYEQAYEAPDRPSNFRENDSEA